MDYDLSCIRRYGNFPAKIAGVALREANDFVHHHTRTEHLFLSFILSLEEKEMLTEYDGIQKRIPSVPYMGLVLPGTIIHTVLPSKRHELFFRYPPETKSFFNLLNLQNCAFHISPEFNDKFQNLKQWLNQIKTPGMADRIDLLAIDLACEARLTAQISDAKTKKNRPFLMNESSISLNFWKRITTGRLRLRNRLNGKI